MDALVSELVPDVLARNVENFLTSLQADADSLRNRVLQLESEINASKQVRYLKCTFRMILSCVVVTGFQPLANGHLARSCFEQFLSSNNISRLFVRISIC